MTVASPQQAQVALRALLSPKPRLNELVNVLQLLAHFQLCRRAIAEQAKRAVLLQNNLVNQLDAEKVSEYLHMRYGALSKKEGRRLERWAHHEDEDLSVISLQMRRNHVARAVSQSNVPLRSVQILIDIYFPSRPERSDRNYIRAMTPEEGDAMRAVGEEMRMWMGLAADADRRNSPRPSLKRLLGDSKDAIPVLSANALKQVDHIARDMADFAAMFDELESLVSVKTEAPLPEQDTSPLSPSRTADAVPSRDMRAYATRVQDATLDFSGDADVALHMQDPVPDRVVDVIKRSPVGTSPRQAPFTSPTAMKRSHVSSGLPPETGPDYTKPLPARRSNETLRPFDMSALQRTGSIKRPRASEEGQSFSKRYRRDRSESSDF